MFSTLKWLFWRRCWKNRPSGRHSFALTFGPSSQGKPWKCSDYSLLFLLVYFLKLLQLLCLKLNLLHLANNCKEMDGFEIFRAALITNLIIDMDLESFAWPTSVFCWKSSSRKNFATIEKDSSNLRSNGSLLFSVRKTC